MFYENFRRLAYQKGVTVSKVTEEVGLSPAAAAWWKKGSMPRLEILQKLSKYFGVEIDDLIGGDPEKERAEMKARFDNPKEEKEWDGMVNETSRPYNIETSPPSLEHDYRYLEGRISRLMEEMEECKKELKEREEMWFGQFQKCANQVNGMKRIVCEAGDHLKAVKDGTEPLEKFIEDFEGAIEFAKKEYNIDPSDPDQWQW